MEFLYNPSQPTTYEGWLSKANIGLFERWQRRFFRIQGRCVYYFKKETPGEPSCGNIPLVDIETKDLASKKGKQFMFSVKLTKNNGIAKRDEYLLMAESEDQRKKWQQKLNENKSVSIVGEPFQLSTEVSPTSLNVHLTLPYFLPPVLQILDSTGYKVRNIWTVEVPNEIISKGLATLNFNSHLHTEDIHNAVAIVLAYLRALPSGLLPSENISKFSTKVNPEDLRDLVRASPAPVRQFLHDIGLHFKKVLDNSASNGVTLYSLLPLVGPILITPPQGSSMVPSQTKSIQDQVAQCFLQNATKILEDVHQFLDAPRQQVIRRARVIQSVSAKTDECLEASRGLLVYVVREDTYGWCTVYTSNRRVGLMHNTNLKQLTAEEEKELNSGPNIDALMDVAREHVPEMMLLFDGMNDEIMKIRDALEVVRA